MQRQQPFEARRTPRGETVVSFGERPADRRDMQSYQERRRD